MRKLSFLIVAAGLYLVPAAAHAGFGVEASLGYGLELKPDVQTAGYNAMVAVGYGVLGKMLRAELGFVGAKNTTSPTSVTQLELRPMVVFDPPFLPFYLRGVGAFDHTDAGWHTAWGGFAGVGGSLFGLGIFGEVGALPQFVSGQTFWIGEARLGAYYF